MEILCALDPPDSGLCLREECWGWGWGSGDCCLACVKPGMDPGTTLVILKSHLWHYRTRINSGHCWAWLIKQNNSVGAEEGETQ